MTSEEVVRHSRRYYYAVENERGVRRITSRDDSLERLENLGFNVKGTLVSKKQVMDLLKRLLEELRKDRLKKILTEINGEHNLTRALNLTRAMLEKLLKNLMNVKIKENMQEISDEVGNRNRLRKPFVHFFPKRKILHNGNG